MKRIVLILTAVVLFCQMAGAQKIPAGFDEYCEKTFNEWQFPAMAIVIVKDGEVVYLKGFGKDQNGNKVDPVTSQFVIASSSKAFTGALLATVIDEYDVKWDDPVVKHLPDFKMNDEWVTNHMMVKELNTHHNGWTANGLDDLPEFGYTRDDLFRIFSAIKPTYEFRVKYTYSNHMYTTTAKIIEKYTGLSWDDAMAERIFKPLKMVHSTTGAKAYWTSENLVRGSRSRYDREKGKVVFNLVTDKDRKESFEWLTAVAPAAFVTTTAADMGNWLKMHLNHGIFEGDTVISRRNHDYLFAPQSICSASDSSESTYAQGWRLRQTPRYRLISHSGLAGGYTSYVGFIPSMKLGFAMLTNNGSGSSAQGGIADKLIDMYQGVDGPDYAHESYVSFVKARTPRPRSGNQPAPNEEVKSQSLPNALYAGKYFQEAFGTAEVYTKEDGKMYFKLKNVDSVLTHKDGDTFTFTGPWGGRYKLTFKVEEGTSKSLTFDIGDPIEDLVKQD